MKAGKRGRGENPRSRCFFVMIVDIGRKAWYDEDADKNCGCAICNLQRVLYLPFIVTKSREAM